MNYWFQKPLLGGTGGNLPSLTISSLMKREKSEQKTLESIPSEVLDHILTNSTMEEQEKLHNTSLGLSSFGSSSYKSYEEIQVFLTDTDISLKIKENKPDAMSNHPLGEKKKIEETVHENETRSLTDAHEAVSLLKSILEPTKTKIDNLNIQYDENMVEEERKQQFHEAIINIFKELKSVVHVEKLTIAVENQDQLMEVLEKMKIGQLTELHLVNCYTEHSPLFSMDKICSSGHWENICYLSEKNLTLDLSLNQLVNIENVFATVIDQSKEGIVSYKDALLRIPKNFCHLFIVKLPEGLIDAMKPFNPSKDITMKNEGSYRCENNRTLHFSAEDYALCFETELNW